MDIAQVPNKFIVYRFKTISLRTKKLVFATLVHTMSKKTVTDIESQMESTKLRRFARNGLAVLNGFFLPDLTTVGMSLTTSI